jgi:proline dehydrogenase
MSVTVDYLGESVDDASLAIAARDAIADLLDAIDEHKVNANVSLKLTQLGMDIDTNLAYENLRYLLQHAQKYGNKVRVDMEDSPWTDATLDMYRKLRDEDGLTNVGVVIQAYLYRSDADIAQLVDEGAWVRLVKGAYLEPDEVAYPKKSDTDKAYVRQMEMLLGEKARERGVYAGIATHDENMIQATIQYANTHNIAPNEYEFQMLFGVRRDRQESLVAEGYQMRVYVPFGEAWYPYFMRRLAERPANIWFFLSNLF